MYNDIEMQNREHDIKERDLYIDQIEARIHELEAELTQKDHIIQEQVKLHRKGVKSSNNIQTFIEGGKHTKKSSNNAALSEELGHNKQKSCSDGFSNPVTVL